MERRRPIDFPALRGRIKPRQVLELMDWQPNWRRGELMKGPCPFHGSSSRTSRTLSVCDRVVYCHKCRATGDAVRIWAHHRGIDDYDAAVDLCTRFNLPIPFLSK